MLKGMIPWYTKAKAALKERGLIYDDVAQALHVTVSAVGHYLSGRREPSLEQVKTIARMVDKSISELCGEDAYFVVKTDEQRLIDAFRQLSDDEQKFLLKQLTGITLENPLK